MIILRTLLCLLLFSGSAFAAEPIELTAGRVSMLFEPDSAFVRYVRVGEYKVLQGISAPVRDQFWGTVPPAVSNVRVQQAADAFQLAFDVSCRQGAIDFAWQGSIAGDAKGNITFKFDGVARSEFLRNRIGYCVLHGPEAAGRTCVVETVDRQELTGHFPEFISPHQPFKNIRTISHELAEGVWVRVRMEGDAIRSAKQFVGERPLLVSPITLKKQAIDALPSAGELPSNVDPRQMSPFAAAWTLGSIKYLAEAGAASTTYYETVGWLGIMEAETGSPLPNRFPSRPGQLFPIYHVLRELALFAGGRVRTTSSADPMTVIGLAVEKGNQRRLLLANLTPAGQPARVLGFGERVTARQLEASGFSTAVGEVQSKADGGLLLELPPYGITILEPNE